MDIMIPVIIAWIVMILTAILTLFISKLFHFSKEVTGALMLVAVLTNSSFLGIPIINAYLGDMMMNFYYSIMSVYGWYNWARKKNDSYVVPISRTNKKEKCV